MTKKPKKLVPKVGDLVVVRWDDILEDSGWQDSEHPNGDVRKCESVGWVARWERKKVVLTRTFGADGGTRHAGDHITIPRGVVTGWEVLRPSVPAQVAAPEASA